MKSASIVLAGGLAMLLGAPSAHAGQPLQTDDAGVLERAACELEGAALQNMAPEEREESVVLTCGVGWGYQLGFALSLDGTSRRRQAGAVMGGKGVLWSSVDSDAALSLGWQVAEAHTARGSWHRVATGLNLIASIPLSSSNTLHANLGHARNEMARAGSSTWGLAIEHSPSEVRCSPMAEMFGDDRQKPWINAGVRWEALEEKLFISGAFGRQLDPVAAKLATVSFRIAL